MNTVKDIEFICTSKNIMRTDYSTNTNWTYTFDFKVTLHYVVTHLHSKKYYFVCRKHLCVEVLSVMLLLKHV